MVDDGRNVMGIGSGSQKAYPAGSLIAGCQLIKFSQQLDLRERRRHLQVLSEA